MYLYQKRKHFVVGQLTGSCAKRARLTRAPDLQFDEVARSPGAIRLFTSFGSRNSMAITKRFIGLRR